MVTKYLYTKLYFTVIEVSMATKTALYKFSISVFFFFLLFIGKSFWYYPT